MNNLKTSVIIVVLAITAETQIHPEKSTPHVHTELNIPITKWNQGTAQFYVSGSTASYYTTSQSYHFIQ